MEIASRSAPVVTPTSAMFERPEPQGPDTDVDEVHDTLRGTQPVYQVAQGATGNEGQGDGLRACGAWRAAIEGREHAKSDHPRGT